MLNLRQFIFILLFYFLDRFQDPRADLHQIFQEDGKWAANKKVKHLFYQVFRFGHTKSEDR